VQHFNSGVELETLSQIRIRPRPEAPLTGRSAGISAIWHLDALSAEEKMLCALLKPEVAPREGRILDNPLNGHI
jgi:hypothetical protein